MSSLRDGRSDVGRVATDPEATLGARIDAIKRLLSQADYAGQPVMLALASPWCLSATISTDELGRGGRRRAMAFHLEEHLPVSAEEVVAEYVELGKRQALGVCAEIGKLKAIVQGLEGAGVQTRHICPTALLMAAHVAGRHPQVSAVLACGTGGDAPAACDFIELQEGKPARWWWLADDDATLRERLGAWAASQTQPAQLAVIGCDPAALDGLDASEKLQCTLLNDVSACDAATREAAAILEGTQSPWVDFRRDALAAPNRFQAHRKPIGALVAAVVLLLVCVSLVAQWRGRQYAALSRLYAAQQADVFRTALPNQRVPGNIKERLVSERRKLAPLGGRGSDGAGVIAAETPSALTQLRDVLTGLPADVRYRVLDLNIQPDLVRIEGEARSHVEAESIANALRKSGLYEVEPPRTEAIKDGSVSFAFAAKPRGSSSALKADGQ